VIISPPRNALIFLLLKQVASSECLSKVLMPPVLQARRLGPSGGVFFASVRSVRVRDASVITSSRVNCSLPLISAGAFSPRRTLSPSSRSADWITKLRSTRQRNSSTAVRAFDGGRGDGSSGDFPSPPSSFSPLSSSSTTKLSSSPRVPRSPSTAVRAVNGRGDDGSSGGFPLPSTEKPAKLSSSSWQYERLWWPLTVAAAAFTALFTPWQLAFGPTENVDFYGDPLHSWEALVEAALSLFWAGDIAASLWLVEQDAGDVASVVKATATTTTTSSAAKNSSSIRQQHAHLKGSSSAAPALISSDYSSSPAFLLDVASVVPWDFFAVFAFAGGPQAAAASGVLPFLSLLRLATLARLHRVRTAFSQLEYDTRLDLLWVS